MRLQEDIWQLNTLKRQDSGLTDKSIRIMGHQPEQEWVAKKHTFSYDSPVLFVRTVAICLPGCDEEHGFCDKPGECK